MCMPVTAETAASVQGGESRPWAHLRWWVLRQGQTSCSQARSVLSALGARAGVPTAALPGAPATGTEGLGLRQLESAKEKIHRGTCLGAHAGHCGSAGCWLPRVGHPLHVVPGKALLCPRGAFRWELPPRTSSSGLGLGWCRQHRTSPYPSRVVAPGLLAPLSTPRAVFAHE